MGRLQARPPAVVANHRPAKILVESSQDGSEEDDEEEEVTTPLVAEQPQQQQQQFQQKISKEEEERIKYVLCAAYFEFIYRYTGTYTLQRFHSW